MDIKRESHDLVIKFAGDPGEEKQVRGMSFPNYDVLLGIDLASFPDFPSEISLPKNFPGMSGYKLRFRTDEAITPGSECDVLVAMNAAALKENLKNLKKGGRIIADTEGFSPESLRQAKYPIDANPLEDHSLDNYTVVKMDVTKMTRDALEETSMSQKEKDRLRNMFVLGYLYWMYKRDMENTIQTLTNKFDKKPKILEGTIKALRAGYAFGENAQIPTPAYHSEMPNDADSKSVFDLTDEEEATRLQSVTDRLKQEIYAKGLPIVYQDDRCPTEDYYIQEYEDGRVHLVVIDIPNMKYVFVKDLKNA